MIRFVSLKALCSTITFDSGKAETKSKNPDLIISQFAVRIFYFGYTISLTKSLCLVQIVSFESLLSKSVSVSECLPILLFPLSIGVCISSRKKQRVLKGPLLLTWKQKHSGHLEKGADLSEIFCKMDPGQPALVGKSRFHHVPEQDLQTAVIAV